MRYIISYIYTIDILCTIDKCPIIYTSLLYRMYPGAQLLRRWFWPETDSANLSLYKHPDRVVMTIDQPAATEIHAREVIRRILSSYIIHHLKMWFFLVLLLFSSDYFWQHVYRRRSIMGLLSNFRGHSK